MDQQFKSDVTHNLMADYPTVSVDEAFQEESYDDGFEGDNMEAEIIMDDANQYDEEAEIYGDEAYFGEERSKESFEGVFENEFSREEMNIMDAMEEAVANALDAENSDEFFRQLLSGIRGIVCNGSQSVGTTGCVAGQASDNSTRGARSAKAVAIGRTGQQRLLTLLQQHADQRSDEMDTFEALADLFVQEGMDEALPILSGVVARVALRPLLQRNGAIAGQAVNRQIVRGATQAARNLVSRQGAQAIRALRPIATSVGRVAVRRGMKSAALPNAIRQAVATVAAQPTLARRLAQTTVQTGRTEVPRSRLSISGDGVPRRFVVNGPVEIIIRR